MQPSPQKNAMYFVGILRTRIEIIDACDVAKAIFLMR
jgi:hypothetical protein